MEQPILRIDHLTVRYGKTCGYCRGGGRLEKNTCPRCKTVWACNDVNIQLYEGEILGIVGESGSGKSTLMKSLYFDFDVTEGQGYLRDFRGGKEDIFSQSLPQKKYIKNHIMGMVYQNPVLGLRMDYSSAGNIAEKLIAAGHRNYGKMNERVEELLNAVEILPSRKKSLLRISAAECSREYRSQRLWQIIRRFSFWTRLRRGLICQYRPGS